MNIRVAIAREPAERPTRPSLPDVRGALERLIESAAFAASPQLAAFLRFVVEATLAGDADSLKAYTIAIDALGRPDTFDPMTDAIVRVSAGRMRRALTRYYDGEGARDPVVIQVPSGSYVPVFRWRRPTGGAAKTDESPTEPAATPSHGVDRPDAADAYFISFASVRAEGMSVLRERHLLFAQCHRRMIHLHGNLARLRAEIATSQSVVLRSRLLIERHGNRRRATKA